MGSGVILWQSDSLLFKILNRVLFKESERREVIVRALAVTVLISLTIAARTALFSEDLIHDVILNHPLYLSAIAQEEAAEKGVDKEYLRYFPMNAGLSADTYGSLMDPDLNYTLGININYTFFDPDINSSIMSQKILLMAAGEYNKSLYLQLKYRILKLLVQYRGALSREQLARENYASLNEYTEKIRQRFKGSDLSRSELSYAESVLYKNRAQIIEAGEYREKILHMFRSETGQDVTDEWFAIRVPFEILTEEQILKRVAEHPETVQARLLVDQVKSLRDNYKGNSSPLFKVSASVKYPFSLSSSWQAGVDVTIPLYGIVYDGYVYEEYSLEIESREKQFEHMIRERISLVKTTSDRIQSIGEKLEVYRQAMAFAEESYQGVLTESRAGVRTVFDVIESRNSLWALKKEIAGFEMELNLARLEYSFFSGGLQ